MLSIGHHRVGIGKELLQRFGYVAGRCRGAASIAGQASTVGRDNSVGATQAKTKPLQELRVQLLERLQKDPTGKFPVIFEINGAGLALGDI